ncbi:MAG: hypothetical protein AW08_02262 [Candidatus Accumulibacter adjunctus]|uniref:Uncharacterized protein n=1 Tax=Candidatus Accumulibacter adjunctus TaxID=1454001 RepID=A0A011NRJ5_9PROT|nr:MAG: hypothetical protein AW08_02262 [Candidatus Accumulibacter adjunctus]
MTARGQERACTGSCRHRLLSLERSARAGRRIQPEAGDSRQQYRTFRLVGEMFAVAIRTFKKIEDS